MNATLNTRFARRRVWHVCLSRTIGKSENDEEARKWHVNAIEDDISRYS